MAKTINFINEHIFIFVAAVILGALVISVLMVISPEKSMQFNFDPFPKIAPSSLPDPNRQRDQCWDSLTPCTPGGDNECSACSAGEYECVTVGPPGGHRHFNGINVPEGNWCLPKDKNPAGKICNEYTGRYMWVFDPEYCSQIAPGSTQCWKCECLYPNLFSDPARGCTSSIACQNDSVNSNTLSQPGNKLQATKCALESIQSCSWDPTSEQKSCEDTALYQYTPYDQDKNGFPWFTCKCPNSAGNQFFHQLPGDPYNCHLDPCYSSLKNITPGLDNCTDNCGAPTSCTCSCEHTNVALVPPEVGGIYEGTCVLVENSCAQFGYDKQSKNCTCPSPYWPQQCRSPNTGANMDKPELPECIAPENSLGTQCINPCEGGPGQPVCQHGSVCVSCGPNTYSIDPLCNMDQWIPDTADSQAECDVLCKKYNCTANKFEPNENCKTDCGSDHCCPDDHPVCDQKNEKCTKEDGTDPIDRINSGWCYLNIVNHNRTHAQCDCRSVADKPGPPFSGFSGTTCAVECLPDGHRIKSHLFWDNCSCWNCACCCSQRKKKKEDFWSLAYDVLCDGDYNPHNPPQDGCSPAEDCPASKDASCHESFSC